MDVNEMSCPNDKMFEQMKNDFEDVGWEVVNFKKFESDVPSEYIAKQFEPLKFQFTLESDGSSFGNHEVEIVSSRVPRIMGVSFDVNYKNGRLQAVIGVGY